MSAIGGKADIGATLRECLFNDPKPTLSSTMVLSERGGPLAQEHLYKYRSGWRLQTAGKPETVPLHARRSHRTLLLNVGAALLVQRPANLSEFSKRH